MDKPNKLGRDVKAAAGITDRGLLHRWRHSLSTRLNEHGTDLRVVEHILGHKIGGVLGLYNHAEHMAERREAMQWWGRELAEIVAGEGTPEARKRARRR